MQPFWVFGYGSLLWDPGFAWTARHPARLEGFHRSFCMRSIHHRGTPEEPGLVLALDAAEGAACRGIAFEVAAEIAEETLEYLRARELISAAYLEAVREVALDGGGRVEALVYVIDRAHWQYCGDLPLEEQAEIIARAHGGRGANRDYLFQTAAHLTEIGISDPDLHWLTSRVSELAQTELSVGKHTCSQ